jgi:hypothetical protein
MVSILKTHQSNPLSSHRLEGLAMYLHILPTVKLHAYYAHRAMEHQVATLRSNEQHTAVRRAAEGKKDAAEIVGAYRTLSYLFDAFQVSIN